MILGLDDDDCRDPSLAVSSFVANSSSAVIPSFNLEYPVRSAAIFFRLASGECKPSSVLLLLGPPPPSDGVALRSRLRFSRGVLMNPKFSQKENRKIQPLTQ